MKKIFQTEELIKRILIAFDCNEELEKFKSLVDFDLYQNLQEFVYSQIDDILEGILAREYHFLKDQRKLVAYNREERLNRFNQLIIEPNYFRVLIEKYEMFEPVMRKSIINTLLAFKEIILNYQQDKSKLEAHFNQELGRIIGIDTSMGDVHEGKSVAKVIFEKRTLYYKPQKSTNLQFWHEFLDIMEKHGICDFKKIRTVYIDNHTWQESIEYQNCNSFVEAQKYYYRAGVLLSIMLILKTKDIHHENIICVGEYPIIIDVETISASAKEDSIKIYDGKDITNSLLDTAMLPIDSLLDMFDFDVSGLFSTPGEKTSNRIYKYTLELDEEEDIIYSKEFIKNKVEKNILYVDNIPIKAHEVEESLLAGFTSGCLCIVENKQEFSNVIKNDKYQKMKIRELLRPTQAYYQFLAESKNPEILASEESYDNLFEILHKNFKPSKFGYLRVDKEIDDLKKGSIPLFFNYFDETNLWSGNEIICEGFYELSPKVNCLKSLEKLDEKMIEYQKRLIRMSIFIASVNEKKYRANIFKDYQLQKEKQTDIKKYVSSYIDYLKLNQIHNKVFKHSTLYIPTLKDDVFVIDILKSGLYEGGGIIHLISTYGKIFNDVESQNIAKENILHNYEVYKLQKATKEIRRINYSLHEGEGGLVYIAYNFYKMYNDIEILGIFEKILNDFFEYYSKNDLERGLDDDFINGLGSFVFFIGRLFEDTDDIGIKSKIKIFIEKYFLFIEKNIVQEIGIAHGISGICINLAYIYKITKNSKSHKLLFKLIEKEERLIEQKVSSEPLHYSSWCRGISGVILSRAIISEVVEDIDEKKYFDELVIKHANETNINHIFSLSNPCLCHGIYGNIESIKYAEKRQKLATFDSYRENTLFTTKDLNDYEWFENSTYPYESFMVGKSGVVYGFLSSYDSKVPSTLAVEIYTG